MADIRLPNGQIVAGVPDDVSQEDLVEMLRDNGHDVSWYKPPERSYPERVLKEGLPAVANFGADILSAIPSGLRGAGEAAIDAVASPFTGRTPDQWLQRGVEGYESNMEYLRENTPRFRDPQVQETEGALMHGVEAAMDAIGGGAERGLTDPASTMPGLGAASDLMGLQRPMPDFAGAPGTRTTVEAATNFLPIPGAALASKGVRRAFPGLDPAKQRAAKLDQLEKLQQKIDREKADIIQQAQTPELFDTQLHPAERSPFKIPEQDRMAAEAELADPRKIEYPPDLLRDDTSPQGGLFNRLEDQPAAFSQEGGRTPRTGPEVDIPTAYSFDPESLTHRQAVDIGRQDSAQTLLDNTTGRGSRGESVPPQRGAMDFDTRPESRYPEAMSQAQQEAAAKPGFMRSAEETMRAKEWEATIAKLDQEAQQRMAETDPLGDRMPMNKGPKGRQVGAIKKPGGMWLESTKDEWKTPFYTGDAIRAGSLEEPINKWADKVIDRYFNKYAGTARDPLKDIEIPYGRDTARWEDLTDSVFTSKRADETTRPNKQGGYNYYSDDPRIRPEEQIYRSREPSDFTETPVDSVVAQHALSSYLDHVKDYLYQHVRPDQLDRYDFVRAVKETAEWDKQMAKKMEKARVQSQKDMTVYKTYPDGYRWVQLDKPGQFAAESDIMGHSVRGYEPPSRDHTLGRGTEPHGGHADWIQAAGNAGHPNYGLGGWDAIKRGDAQVFSLRDPQGRSHVTIEVGKDTKTIQGADGYPEAVWDDAKPLRITQIKGKQNRTPEDKYLPYVQDFVKSKEWGDVGELYNTGLRDLDVLGLDPNAFRQGELQKIKEMFPGQRYVSEEQISQAVQTIKNQRDGLIDGGPGTSQRGGPGKPRGRSSDYEQFKKEAKARGIMLPDEVIEAVYKGKDPEIDVNKSKHPHEHIKRVLEKNKALNQLKDEFVDDRPLPEIEKLLKEDPTVRDIDWNEKHAIGKIINGSFIASRHPLISRASSEINKIKDWELVTGNKYMHGKSAKHPDEGTANYYWKQLKPDEREAVRAVGWEINNIPEQLTPDQIQRYSQDVNGRPLSEPELKALQDRTAIMRKVLEEEVNPIRVAEGKDPIRPLPNFFSPTVIDTPFKVIFYGKNGDPIHIEGMYLRPNMDKIWKEFGGQYDKDKIRLVESQIRTSADLETFELILRQLDKQARSQASSAITEGLRRLGFAKHGMKRKGAAGGRGSTPGKNAVRDYEKVYEEYVREMMRYVGNRKLDKFFNELNALDIPQHSRAKMYALEAVDVTRGGSNKAAQHFDKFVTRFLNGAIETGTFGKLGLPETFWADFLKLGASIKVPLLIGFFHPIHIAAQILQHTFMIPAAMRMAQPLGIVKQQHAVWNAVFKAYGDMMSDVTGKGKRKKAIDKINEIGGLDATVKFDWVNYASQNLRDTKTLMSDHLTGVSLLTNLEKHGVRKPAAYITLNLLEELGADLRTLDSPEAARLVKGIVTKYMVDNRYHNKAHIFTRSGLTGTALSPLMNFMTTWLGMFTEFHRLAKSGYYVTPSKTAPFVTFMALNLVTAGALNLIGTKEYNLLASLSNQLFGTKLPMWEEIVWSKDYMGLGKEDGKTLGISNTTLAHGALTDATELNVGATFNAPTVAGNYAAGATFWADMVGVAWAFGKHAAGKSTTTEMRDAVKKGLPRHNITNYLPNSEKLPFSWYSAEKSLTPEDIPYQSTGETASYMRDEEDWQARKLGTYTRKEAEYKSKTQVARDKAAARTTRFRSSMNKIGDRLLIQQQMDISDLMPKLIEDGYTYDDILNGVRAELRSRLVEPQAQMQGQGTSSRQQMIYKLLRDLEGR